ncbi:mechanosensitive ion channel family protein [Haloarchaeobius sp. TZWSO28]|uniref:mechanosensitive ion channel family protein n=1 Tax=Haloarchaeobius sp. TZWSO28 TaxID=3446119 RepID=UPI003EBBCB61
MSQTDIVLQQTGDMTVLQDVFASIVDFLPNVIGALIILVVGWIVARVAGSIVTKIIDKSEIDKQVLKTPLGRMLGGTEKAISGAFGTLARLFIYAITLLAATEVLAIQTLSEWVATATTYLPAFIAGLAVIVLGFVVADWIGDTIARTQAATDEGKLTGLFATGTRLFLYFTALTIGLDTMGLDVAILYVVAQAAAYGLGAALAIGVGIALGWGGKDYVSENIANWMGRASGTTGTGPSTPTPGPGGMQPDGGDIDDPADD